MVFDRPGVVVLGCNIHDNMAAWILVVETPFYGKTNDAGDTTMANVPQGTYKLRTWHANLPVGAAALEQTLTVGSTDVSLVVDMKGTKL